MLCKKPYWHGVHTYGCGQCTPCRINKRREWVGRLILEQANHEHSCFITLTYRTEDVPKDLCVSKRTGQLFLKRLRNELQKKNRTFRYYFVGEYGEKSQRPHYHAILFGIAPTEIKLIEKAWPYGFIHVGTAEKKSMSYCGSYVVKKWTRKGDPNLKGRTPEFAIMSRNPGIGGEYAERVSKAYQTESGMAALRKTGYFETTFNHDGKKYPLSRYIREKICEKMEITKDQKNNWLGNVRAQKEAKLLQATTTEMHYERQIQMIKDNHNLNRKTRRTL